MGYLNRLLCLLSIPLMPLTCLWRTFLYISRLKYMYMLSLIFVYLTGFLALIQSKVHTLNFKIFLTLFIISLCILLFTIVEWIRKKRHHMDASYPLLIHHRLFHAFENADPEPDAPRVAVVQGGNVINIPPSAIRMPEVPQPEPLTSSEVMEEIYRKISPTASVKSSRRQSPESTKTSKKMSKHVRSNSEPYRYHRRQLSDQCGSISTLQNKALTGTSKSEECVIRIENTRPKENIKNSMKFDILCSSLYNIPYEKSIEMIYSDKTVSRKTSLSPKTSRYVRPKSPTEFKEVIIRKHSMGSRETPEPNVSKHKRHHSEPYKFHRRHVRSEQIKQAAIFQNEKQPEISRSIECVIEADIHPEPKEKIELDKLNSSYVSNGDNVVNGKSVYDKKAFLTSIQCPKTDLIVQKTSSGSFEDQTILEFSMDTCKNLKQKVSSHKRHHSEPYEFYNRQVRFEHMKQSEIFPNEKQPKISRSVEWVIQANIHSESIEQLESLKSSNSNDDPNLMIVKSSCDKKASLMTVQYLETDLTIQSKSHSATKDQVIRELNTTASKITVQKMSKHKRHHSEPYKFHRQVRSINKRQTDTSQDEIQSLSSRSEECIIKINFYTDNEGKVSATVVEDNMETSLESKKTENADLSLSQKQVCVNPVHSSLSQCIECASNWKLLDIKETTSSGKTLQHFNVQSKPKVSEQLLKFTGTSKASEQQAKLSNISIESDKFKIASTSQVKEKQQKTAILLEDVRRQHKIAGIPQEAGEQHETLGTPGKVRLHQLTSKLQVERQQKEVTITSRDKSKVTRTSGEEREQHDVVGKSGKASEKHEVALASQQAIEQHEILGTPGKGRLHQIASKLEEERQQHEVIITSRDKIEVTRTSEEKREQHDFEGKSGKTSQKQISIMLKEEKQQSKIDSSSLESEKYKDTRTSKTVETGEKSLFESVEPSTSKKQSMFVGEISKQFPSLDTPPDRRSRKKSKKVSETTV